MAFLRNDMIARCCPKATVEAYAKGTLCFDDASKTLNIYTTTLHAINSAIVKMSKASAEN